MEVIGSPMLLDPQIHELLDGAAAFGLRLDEAQAGQFGKFYDMLYKHNAAMDLTAMPRAQAVSLHFIDSLSFAAVCPLSEASSLLDVGSGAGFPGIPLKIASPALETTLLESSEKRVKFLRALIEELELKDIRVEHGRAETLGHDATHREKYQTATARAVAHLAPLSEMLLPFVRVGGAAIAYKSALSEEEIEESRQVIRELGGEIEKVHALRLPPAGGPERCLVLIRKHQSCAGKFPRSGQYLARVAKKLKR